MCYWKEKVPEAYNVKRRFPCFLLTEGEESEEHIYGLPSNEYPGLVKVRHGRLHRDLTRQTWQKLNGRLS